MRNFIKNHYINEKANTNFAILILFNIIICFLSYYAKLENYIGKAGGILTVAGFFGIGMYIGQKGTRSSDTQKGKTVLDEPSINRACWFSQITDKKGIVLLTGVSGIGKTCLLDQLKAHFDKKGISYYFEDGNYFRKLDLRQMQDKDYVILDQFERALAFDNIRENISALKNLADKNMIISVRKEYLGDVYRLLGFDTTVHLVWLDYSEDDIKEIESFLGEIARKTEEGVKGHKLYGRILKDIQQGNLSMIQLSFLIREIQYKEEEYVMEQLDRYYHIEIIEQDDKQAERKVYDYDNVIMDFFREQLDSYENSETAYLILFLLCLDHKGQYMNTIKDFQNICIRPADSISSVMEFLFEQKWVKKVKENENVRTDWTEPCEIAHDYLQALFDRLCREHIPAGIRSNIEYYNENCQIQRESQEKTDSWRFYTNKVCQRFLEPKSKIYTTAWLVFAACFLTGITGYQLIGLEMAGDGRCFILAALNYMVGVSVYYMYNYYYYFLTIFYWRYFLGLLLAVPVIIFPFLYTDYWAVSLGIEIIVVGSIMGLISFRVRQAEKEFFKARCFIFCAIGFLVVFLGRLFKNFTQGHLVLALPLFALYSIYITMTVIVHINRPYILEIVGRVLYGGRRMNIK